MGRVYGLCDERQFPLILEDVGLIGERSRNITSWEDVSTRFANPIQLTFERSSTIPNNKAEAKIPLGIVDPYFKKPERIQRPALAVKFSWISKFLWVRRRHM